MPKMMREHRGEDPSKDCPRPLFQIGEGTRHGTVQVLQGSGYREGESVMHTDGWDARLFEERLRSGAFDGHILATIAALSPSQLQEMDSILDQRPPRTSVQQKASEAVEQGGDSRE
jgi:hypothetical protein